MNAPSRHANCRKQQRRIPAVAHDWLQQYGEERFDGHGGIIKYFGHESRRRMESQLGRRFVAENQKYLRCYVVESVQDGTVITTGWRYRRVPRR
jgi:hypothetical protein